MNPQDIQNLRDLFDKLEKQNLTFELLVGIPHDLSGPLGIIGTATSYLQDEIKRYLKKAKGEPSPELQILLDHLEEGFEMVHNSRKATLNILTHMRSIVQYQRDDPKERICIFDVLFVIRTSLNYWLRESNVTLNLQGDQEFSLLCNEGELIRIVDNLVNNVLNHAFEEQDQKEINIAFYCKDEEFILIVSDNGKGIPAEHLDQIFNKGFTTQESQGGTGQGLYIVKSLVEDLMGGNLTCQSEVGKGTAFEIRLPLK